jgi:hypothetical protein
MNPRRRLAAFSRKKTAVVLVVVGTFLLAAMVLYGLLIWPWVSPPPRSAEDIDQDWARVVSLAVPPADCSSRMSSVEGWLNADAKTDSGTLAVETVRRGRDLLSRDALSEPSMSTLVDTVATLCRCGNLIQTLAGFDLARQVMGWAEQHRETTVDIERLSLSEGQLVAALARDAVEIDGMVEDICSDGSPRAAPAYTNPFLDMKRERLWFRYHSMYCLFNDAGLVRPLTDIADQLRAKRPEELPPSRLVRITALSIGAQLHKADDTLRMYRDVLRGGSLSRGRRRPCVSRPIGIS